MSDYIMDMRHCLEESKKPILENPGFVELIGTEMFHKLRYESDHYPSVYIEDLKVGDRLYIYDCVDGYMTSTFYWLEMEVTHIYGGVIFYKIVDAPSDDVRWTKERRFVSDSILALKSIYPKKVVIIKEYEFVCDCPRVEFIYDENKNNKYSSVYCIKEERRY